MVDKARRERVSLGSSEIEGFQMPDGSYRMSQSSAAESIQEPPVYALRFLSSKDAKALLGERYTDYTPEQIEIEPEPGKRGQSRINALPLEVVSAYWLYRAYRGNKHAFVLCFVLMVETLERRFDKAFGVTRTDGEYNQRLSDRFRQAEQQLLLLANAYAEPDILRTHISQLEEQIRQLGGEPWQLLEQDAEE